MPSAQRGVQTPPWRLGEYQEAASLYRRAYMQTAPRERASRGALAYKMGEAYRSLEMWDAH